MAPTTVAQTTIHYTDPKMEGQLFYAKAQVAGDLSGDLRRFAAQDPTFPRYSTARQLLTNDQFRNLVDLGRESGAKLVNLYKASGPVFGGPRTTAEATGGAPEGE